MQTLNDRQLKLLDGLLNNVCEMRKTAYCRECPYLEVRQEAMPDGTFKRTQTCFLNDLQEEIIRENDRRKGELNPIDAALKELRG